MGSQQAGGNEGIFSYASSLIGCIHVTNAPSATAHSLAGPDPNNQAVTAAVTRTR